MLLNSGRRSARRSTQVLGAVRASGLVAVLIAASFGAAANPTDFSLRFNATQTVELGDDQDVTVRCFCPSLDIQERAVAAGNPMQIHMTGTYSSVGYHRARDRPPEAVPDHLQRFTVTSGGDGLILESQEFRHIHHLFVLDTVEVDVPDGVRVLVVKYSRYELDLREPVFDTGT